MLNSLCLNPSAWWDIMAREWGSRSSCLSFIFALLFTSQAVLPHAPIFPLLLQFIVQSEWWGSRSSCLGLIFCVIIGQVKPTYFMTLLFPSYYSLFSMLNSGEVKYYFTVIQEGKRHLLLCYFPNCYCCLELEQNSGENVKLVTVITATVVESILKPNRHPPPTIIMYALSFLQM